MYLDPPKIPSMMSQIPSIKDHNKGFIKGYLGVVPVNLKVGFSPGLVVCGAGALTKWNGILQLRRTRVSGGFRHNI